MVITNGFTFIALEVFLVGILAYAEKNSRLRVFRYFPAMVIIYIINMALCTLGLFSSPECAAAEKSVRSNLLYAMIFVMLLNCDIRKLARLSVKMVVVFLAGSLTLAAGFIGFYAVFKNHMGPDTWGSVAALYASWVGGSANMAAMQEALPVDAGAYSCALAVDSVVGAFWIPLLVYLKRSEDRWNSFAGTSTDEILSLGKSAEKEKNDGQKKPADFSDWLFLMGIAMAVSVLVQWLGGVLYKGLTGLGIYFLDKGAISTLLATFAGLFAAMTRASRMPAAKDLALTYQYVIIALLSSTASLADLLSAPVWVVFGLLILLVHTILMMIFAKLFHWDLCMIATSSAANITGPSIATVVAEAYHQGVGGIGILMGCFGAAIGNFMGLGMGVILKLLQ